MRVWDVHPGYLDRKRLLGQHVEIHGLWTVLTGNRQGYSHHPETKRWRGQLPWLAQVHNLTVAEMTLRGYKHQSPLDMPGGVPAELDYVDSPLRQFMLLREKQQGDLGPRLVIPKTLGEFWASHRYSVMARGRDLYNSKAAQAQQVTSFSMGEDVEFIEEVLTVLRQPPDYSALFKVLKSLAQTAGIDGEGTKGLALALYRKALEEDSQLRGHTVYTDALAYGEEA